MDGQSHGQHSISVFFPAYNDAPSIGALVESAFAVLRREAADYEVIVINDGSADHTADVLAELERRYAPRMKVVTHLKNRGYGAALRSGFTTASKELVFYTDGDGQYDVGELAKLIEKMKPDVGLVNGFKLERNDPQHRIWIGNVYNAFARFLFSIQIRDIDCDFRLIRRRLLEDMKLTSTSGTICVELVRKAELSPYRVEEVGVHHYPRLHGRSQFFRFRSLLKTLYQLFRLYMTTTIAVTVARLHSAIGWTSR
ncbi:MAG: glycosyltransferase family 2 protein [Acidobacteria bacterium]|nr:glycosyltransferase family 2 protein [Acidobacteriota bacterium]MBI3279465.1 glycosyltransferase family 2 protein [Acidobacteriota bacterium]